MFLAISLCAILLPLDIINLMLSCIIMFVIISMQKNCTAFVPSCNISAQVMYQYFSTQPQVLYAHSYLSSIKST